MIREWLDCKDSGIIKVCSYSCLVWLIYQAPVKITIEQVYSKNGGVGSLCPCYIMSKLTIVTIISNILKVHHV